jgi:hypothetical protein
MSSGSTLGAAGASIAGGLGAYLGGQAGTATINYPGQWAAVPQPPFPYDHPAGCVGVFRVRKLENGSLVEWQKYAGAAITEYYAESLKDVGERIAALGVQKALEGDPK